MLDIENGLGLLLLRQGRYEDAELIFREVLRKRREALGVEHSETLISENNLASLLMKQKQTWESGISDVPRGVLGGYPEIKILGVRYPASPR